MEKSGEFFRTANRIVDGAFLRAPARYAEHPRNRVAALLLIEPSMIGQIDPDADDFPMQAINAIHEVTTLTDHLDRATDVFNSGDQELLSLMANVCRQARIQGPHNG